MKPQTETVGITPAELKARLGLPQEAAVSVSGGQLQNFAAGWAHEVMETESRVSHWFTRNGFDRARQLCDNDSDALVRWLHGPGNYPRCGNCVRVMARHIRAGTLPKPLMPKAVP